MTRRDLVPALREDVPVGRCTACAVVLSVALPDPGRRKRARRLDRPSNSSAPGWTARGGGAGGTRTRSSRAGRSTTHMKCARTLRNQTPKASAPRAECESIHCAAQPIRHRRSGGYLGVESAGYLPTRLYNAQSSISRLSNSPQEMLRTRRRIAAVASRTGARLVTRRRLWLDQSDLREGEVTTPTDDDVIADGDIQDATRRH